MHRFTRFETQNAHRYLDALCKHFGRKVETHCGAGQGWAQFPFGRCDMRAAADHLEMTVSADDDHTLDQVVQIVTSHLERYAFRENPTLAWTASKNSLNTKEISQ